MAVRSRPISNNELLLEPTYDARNDAARTGSFHHAGLVAVDVELANHRVAVLLIGALGSIDVIQSSIQGVTRFATAMERVEQIEGARRVRLKVNRSAIGALTVEALGPAGLPGECDDVDLVNALAAANTAWLAEASNAFWSVPQLARTRIGNQASG